MSDSSEVYYIVLRGSGWQPIFKDDEDLRCFTEGVAECAAACRVTVHAFCWLPSEARLAAQMANIPISHFAQCLADYQSRRLEGDAGLTGSHFEQKFRGVRVDGHTALVDLVRHIHLAPLKAGLTGDLLDYAWSSHRAYLGLETSAVAHHRADAAAPVRSVWWRCAVRLPGFHAPGRRAARFAAAGGRWSAGRGRRRFTREIARFLAGGSKADVPAVIFR